MAAFSARIVRATPAITPPTMTNTLAFCDARSAMLVRIGVRPARIGTRMSPMDSETCENATLSLSVSFAVASAVPPTWVSIALRMRSWASSVRFVSTRVLIFSFSCAVNETPDFASAAMPLIGSWSALPSCTAFDSASPKPAAARSMAAFVARSKAPFTSSADLDDERMLEDWWEGRKKNNSREV